MNFYINTIKKDQRFHSTKPISDIMLLEPITREAVQNILRDAKRMGHNMMVFETYRSQELQSIYYKKGVTQLSKVGVHHFGLAADIVKVINGQPSWDGSFEFLQELANNYNLIWGGDWGEPDIEHSFRDVCHVQRVTLYDQKALFAGTWYPDEQYNPYE